MAMTNTILKKLLDVNPEDFVILKEGLQFTVSPAEDCNRFQCNLAKISHFYIFTAVQNHDILILVLTIYFAAL